METNKIHKIPITNHPLINIENIKVFVMSTFVFFETVLQNVNFRESTYDDTNIILKIFYR